jgi:anti-sigma factor RsiW
MTYDQLELAIMQYLDGALPPQEQIALERLLTTDAEAKKLLEEHRSLNAAMRQSFSSPALQWEKLAQLISSSVNDQARQAADGPIEEHVEFTITQYIAGDLPQDEQAALERRLQSDPAAQRVLDEHRSLDAAMRHAWAMPRMHWDALAERLSDAVAEVGQRAAYSIAWVRRAVQLAAAACLLIALGVGLYLYSERPGIPPQFAEVAGPAPEPPAGIPVAEITIGAPDASGFARIDSYSSGIVSLPSRVQIALDARGLPESGLFAQ